MDEPIQHSYRFGPFSIDADKRLLRRDGEIVPLAPKAFDTLLTLVEHRGEVLEKGQLMDLLWPDSQVEEANLPLHISAVRRALGESPNERRYIVTVPGRGYRFAADVARGSEASDVILARYTRSHVVIQEQESNGQLDQMPDGLEQASASAVGLKECQERAILSSEPQRLDAGQEEDDAYKIARPDLPGEPSELPRPQPRAAVTVAALLGIAASALGVYWLITHRQPTANPSAAAPFREVNISRLSTSGKVTHAAISPDGKYVAQVTEDAEGNSLWVRNVAAPTNVRVAGPVAAEYVWVAFAPDGDSIYYLALDRDKGDTILYNVAVLGGPSRKAAYDVGPIGFSPDLKQIAYVRMNKDAGRLIIAAAAGDNERTLATREQPDFFRMIWNAPTWSPDGKTIACEASLNDQQGNYETVVGVNSSDGTQKPLTTARWHHVGQAVWLADSSGLLVTASQDATAPEQVWHITTASGEATRVTHDLNDYHDLSRTGDSLRIAAVQHHATSSIWIAPVASPSAAKQIASDAGWIEELAWAPDGQIVYRSNAGNSPDIWMMHSDGSGPQQLTIDARPNRGLTVSPDGRYIFFASDRAGHSNIWRVDASGAGLKQVTVGEGEFYPQCTPDGRWVVYQEGEIEPALWKVAFEGGEPIQLTKTRACRPAISTDGRMIAYHYLDRSLDRWGVGIVSADGGPILKRFDFPPTVTWRLVRWAPDRQSIAYPDSPGGASGIWLQSINGGAPKQSTRLNAHRILAFDWSSDGRSLAFVDGLETSDVVLIEETQR